MRTRVLMLLTMIMILSILSTPALAGPPKEAEGLMRYTPTIVDVRVADGNTFLHTTEEAEWTGTFSGVSAEEGQVVIHSSGRWSFKGMVSFDGEVDGKSGTLEMSVNGTKPDEDSNWKGRWVILSGTDGLANLRGQGTWEGPGFKGVPGPEGGEEQEWGNIDYSGRIHFEPE